jgi:hypothetical protein
MNSDLESNYPFDEEYDAIDNGTKIIRIPKKRK